MKQVDLIETTQREAKAAVKSAYKIARKAGQDLAIVDNQVYSFDNGRVGSQAAI